MDFGSFGTCQKSQLLNDQTVTAFFSLIETNLTQPANCYLFKLSVVEVRTLEISQVPLHCRDQARSGKKADMGTFSTKYLFKLLSPCCTIYYPTLLFFCEACVRRKKATLFRIHARKIHTKKKCHSTKTLVIPRSPKIIFAKLEHC